MIAKRVGSPNAENVLTISPVFSLKPCPLILALNLIDILNQMVNYVNRTSTQGTPMDNPIVSRSEWLKARKALLEKEKAFTRARDELTRQRLALPWVKIEQPYRFEDLDGEHPFEDLFGQHSQLIVYHFMFGEDWEAGCQSCSFWADNYERNQVHLAARDVAIVAVSTAAPDKLAVYRKRMGWTFPWYSSRGSTFNQDFRVTFDAQTFNGDEPFYNFDTQKFPAPEAPGISVFYKADDGTIFHTYSTFSRGLDMYNAAYHMLDIVPNGRDESDLPYGQAWVRRRDEY